jgi:hypothetical protein
MNSTGLNALFVFVDIPIQGTFVYFHGSNHSWNTNPCHA